MLLTDDHMVPEKIRKQEGYAFRCQNPDCGTYNKPKLSSILAHHKHCPECGISIKIQSKTVTAEINRLQASGGI
jgi:rRNA maturation endonuclease Nob1